MDKLIAVVDADDVILGTGLNKLAYMSQHYPDQASISRIKPYQCSRTALVPIVGLPFYERMNAKVKSSEWTLRASPLEGALNGIQELARMFRIHVLSTRTPEETQYVEEWLRLKGLHDYEVSSAIDPKYNHIEQLSGSKKVAIASHFGARMFIDDDERHMPEVLVEGLDCLLFGEGDRIDIEPHITIARNWNEVVAHAQVLPDI